MDLTILFSAIDESIYSSISSNSSFYKSISIFSDKMPDYRTAHIAIFGVKEDRGTALNMEDRSIQIYGRINEAEKRFEKE